MGGECGVVWCGVMFLLLMLVVPVSQGSFARPRHERRRHDEPHAVGVRHPGKERGSFFILHSSFHTL